MSTSIVNLGEFAKPVTVLVEKISEAIGGLFRPSQIRRIAHAEADAARIAAGAQIEVTEMQRRALTRLVVEEAKKQANIEAIALRAFPDVREDAHPEHIEDDWSLNFFDRCRLISDTEVQVLWARVLAGEANAPGQYSRRTVNFLSSLDRYDARLFTCCCRFVCTIPNEAPFPLIDSLTHEMYAQCGLAFEAIKHLDDIGLITLLPAHGYLMGDLPEVTDIDYFGNTISLALPGHEDYLLEVGHVLFTKTGGELSPIAGPEPVPGFLEYSLRHWKTLGLRPFSKWPRVPQPSSDCLGGQ